MAKKLDMRAPFPNADVLPLRPDGNWSRAWLEFLLTQYRRTGDAQGIDGAAIKAKVDELEMLANADVGSAIVAALLQRVAMLEQLVMSIPVPAPTRSAVAVLPDVVVAPTKSPSALPDSVPVAPRAPDDIRKLIER
ncbi:hypothetical protein [Burkholderia lata]|uniref:Uncharacterized protein n=1 Tax=Burkholderia lata (strain ATCC 17760 / DSM 23089 / LMG 22485 / NCIMB 9086 / R18194 / 383) TaxID=482957 RepID=A0A6P2LGI1_BURL3|nr:hypothetical protein [Burkholderia lata]VWB70521.1 hypothetical protein BLA6863_03307 [Burkholderia lata]